MRPGGQRCPFKVENAVFILQQTFETPKPLVLWALCSLRTYPFLKRDSRKPVALIGFTLKLRRAYRGGPSHTS
jgi:hypothetical protein